MGGNGRLCLVDRERERECAWSVIKPPDSPPGAEHTTRLPSHPVDHHSTPMDPIIVYESDRWFQQEEEEKRTGPQLYMASRRQYISRSVSVSLSTGEIYDRLSKRDKRKQKRKRNFADYRGTRSKIFHQPNRASQRAPDSYVWSQ